MRPGIGFDLTDIGSDLKSQTKPLFLFVVYKEEDGSNPFSQISNIGSLAETRYFCLEQIKLTGFVITDMLR